MTDFVAYEPGTIQVTAGSKNVVGTGTDFTVYSPRDKIFVDGYVIQIDTITNGLNLVAKWNYLGTSGSGKAYTWEPLGDFSRAIALDTRLSSYFSSGNLSAEAALVGAADFISYFTGVGTKALTAFDANARDLLTRFTRATTAGAASLKFLEDTDNGANYVAVQAAASLAANRSFTMPDFDVAFGAFGGASLLATASAAAARGALAVDILGGHRNKIINPEGAVNQRTYTTVADDTYWCDRHYVLTQTAAITPTIIADVADGVPNMMRLTQSQAVAQRMGNAQIIESRDAKRLRGKQVTLGGKLRCSSAQAIRFAVLEWTGTADVLTSDVVNSWTNGTFTAGNFFNSTTLTVTAVGTITPVANTITDWSLLATIGSSANNIIVIYWTEATAAQNVTLDMRWHLVLGDATLETDPLSPRGIQQELALCQRYYQTMLVAMQGQATGNTLYQYTFPVPMRTTPTQANVTAGTLSNAVVGADFGNGTAVGGYFQLNVSVAAGYCIDRKNAYDAEL